MVQVTNPTPIQFLSKYGKSGVELQPGASVPLTVLSVAAPWDVPPPDATPYMKYGTNTGAAGTVPTLLAGPFTVPIGHTGWVRALALQCLAVTPTTELYFQLQVNGSPVPGWGQVNVLPGSLTVWSESFASTDILIQVPGGQTVGLYVVVSDGGTYQVSGQFSGWHVGYNAANLVSAAYGGS